MIRVEILDYAGLLPALQAVHLPFGKSCDVNDQAECSKAKNLITRLIKAGDEHAKVTRGIVVWMDISAPIYWWREMETYRIGRERLSCESTMHIDCKGLKGEELQKAKADIPMGRQQRAIDMYSYQCLRRIYHQRKNHRLPEWQEFCKVIEQLPLAKEFITNADKD